MVVRPVRQVGKRVVRVVAVPTRALVRATTRGRPALERRTAEWTWLWQPGWGRGHHERFYGARPDPYGFGTQPYELAKYADLLDQLRPGGPYRRVLEIGCSEGVFTEQLATISDSVLGTDISEVAIERARDRLADVHGVTLERRTLPLDYPDGDFDLVVASDVLNLWESGTLDVGLERIVGRLRPGGALALLHYLGDFGQPLRGADVHDRAVRVGRAAGMEHRVEILRAEVGPHGAGYRIDVLVAPAGEPKSARRR